MDDHEGSSLASVSQGSLSGSTLQDSYPYDISWTDTKYISDCPADLLPGVSIQLPPISASYPPLAFYPGKTSYSGNEYNINDIDQIPQVNPDHVRSVEINTLTRPLDEQPYQVGQYRMPALSGWPSDQNQFALSRSLTEPMHSQIDELFSTAGSEILATGVGSYQQMHDRTFAVPRARTVIAPASIEDSAAGSRNLHRSISNQTGSQRSRGQGLNGPARRRSNGPPPPCSTCGKILKNQSDVTKHSKSHLKPYKCPVVTCSKHVEGFSTPNDCDRHERSKHGKRSGDNKDRGYICSACNPHNSKSGKWWPRLDNFKSHIVKKHTGHDVEEVIALSLRDRRPDDDTTSIAASNCLSASHADTDMQYQQSYIGIVAQPDILDSSQQGELMSWTASPNTESHDLAGVGQAQSADYPSLDRKYHSISHGCNQIDKQSIFLRPDVVQPVNQVMKEEAELRLAGAKSPRTMMPKIEDLTTNMNFGSYNIYEDEDEECKLRMFPANRGNQENGKSQLLCKHRRCGSTFKRECDRRKHEQRHIRPYGCTWPKCYERHGSKSDWIRHESKLHMLADRWLCDFTDDSGKPCRTCFWKAGELYKHVQLHHISRSADPDAVVSKERIDEMRLGKQGQDRFWCGFCCAVIPNPVQMPGKDSWTARCDHVGTHIDSKGGQHIKDWVCIEFMKTKSELMAELKLKGKHPEPYNNEKSMPVPFVDAEWDEAVLNVDEVLPVIHTSSWSGIKNVSFKPEPM